MGLDDTMTDDTPIFDDRAIEAGFNAYWGDKYDGGDAFWTNARRAAHRAYCKRAYEDAKEIADLKAKLTQAEQAYEVISDDRRSIEKELFAERDAQDTPRADHAATVAELRGALEKAEWADYYDHDNDMEDRRDPAKVADEDGEFSMCTVCHQTDYEGHLPDCAVKLALATPSGSGAAAVLAAADRVHDTEQAFAERKSAEVAKGRQGNARYREWPELMATIEAQEMLLDAVADCRKRLGK